jgi:hypothetical protein
MVTGNEFAQLNGAEQQQQQQQPQQLLAELHPLFGH